MNRRRWKDRATKLHIALHIAAEQTDELWYKDKPTKEEADEMTLVLRDLANAIYYADQPALEKLVKQFKATIREIVRDGYGEPPD